MNDPETLGRFHYKPAGRHPTPLLTTTDIGKVNCPSCRDYIRSVVEKRRKS